MLPNYICLRKSVERFIRWNKTTNETNWSNDYNLTNSFFLITYKAADYRCFFCAHTYPASTYFVTFVTHFVTRMLCLARFYTSFWISKIDGENSMFLSLWTDAMRLGERIFVTRLLPVLFLTFWNVLFIGVLKIAKHSGRFILYICTHAKGTGEAVQFGGFHGLPHRACKGENARHLENRRKKRKT